MKQLTSIFLIAFALPVVTLTFLIITGNRPVAAQSQPEFRGLPPTAHCDTSGSLGTRYDVGVNCRYVEIESYPRTFIVYVPVSAQPGAPAVFLFHGTNGDGDGYLQNSGWLPKANAEGIVLVSASGLRYCPKSDPVVHCPSSDPTTWETKWNTYQLAVDYDLDQRQPDYPEEATWPPDDVGFIEQVMDDVASMGNGQLVDSTRFYASGFSGGAGFTARLAREIPGRLAAVAYSSGGIIDTSIYSGTPDVAIPVFAVLGTNEPGILQLTYRDNLTNAAPLPLDPVAFLALDNLMEAYVFPQLDAFDHHYSSSNLTPVETLEGANHTLYRWRTGSTDHIMQIGVLEGLMHTSPVSCDEAVNPLGWNGPDIFWEFFTSAPDYPFTTLPTNSC